VRYEWKGNTCVDRTEVKAISDSDECNNASVFTELKGKNCKNALDAVKNVQARNSAITETTNAATTAYSGMQAMQATGNQDDALARQKNVYQALAVSKLATGALNLQGAMQLKSAASGAEDANSTITSAQQAITQACANAPDEQVCFYQNAEKFGISKDALTYANIERMKRAAAQSHDQAEAANNLAKQSMITGMADALVGLKAMQMAQMAGQAAQQMAPPPVVVPPSTIRFGQSGSSQGDASLAQGTPQAPVDYGVPTDAETFGEVSPGRIEGGLAPGRMGTPNAFKSASSKVSGGGGASASGGRSGSSRGASSARGRGGPRNTAIGEVKPGGAPRGFMGGGDKGDGAGAGANPFADALAKLFPTGQNGKPIVDARQIASGGFAQPEEQIEESNEVMATDLSIFEQITAKYRQLDGSGRF
jgi:hypothetical protein